MLKRNMIFLFSLFFLLMTNCGSTAVSEDHTEKPEQEGYYLIYETDGETIAGYLYVHLPYIFSYDGDGNVEGIECRLNKQDDYFYSYESAKLTEKLFCVKEAEDDIFIENAEGKTYILKEAEKLPEEQQYAFVLKNGYYGVYDRKTEKLQRYLYILGSCLGYALLASGGLSQ